MDSGVSRISFRGGGGGVQNIFVKVRVFAWRVAKPRVCLGGSGACSPEKIFKMVQFGVFWRIFC